MSLVCRCVIYHIRNITNNPQIHGLRHTCRSVVRALVLSRLDYCNSLRTGLKQHDLNRLQRLQNKAARLIHKKPKYSLATPLLTDLHWIAVDQRIYILRRHWTCLFKTVSNTFPSYISVTLDLSKPKRELPRSSRKFGDRAFSIASPRNWNSLPTNIRNASSVEQFEGLLKTHLFNHTI